jgi:hypothetical protein
MSSCTCWRTSMFKLATIIGHAHAPRGRLHPAGFTLGGPPPEANATAMIADSPDLGRRQAAAEATKHGGLYFQQVAGLDRPLWEYGPRNA